MKAYSNILIILFLILFSCKQEKVKDSYSVSVNIKQEGKVSIFDLFEKVEIIPLETNENSLINYVNQINICDGRLYISDLKAMRILIFDNYGKYLGDVGKLGGGPGEFFNIGEFLINKHKKSVSILSNIGTIYDYDYNGVFIDKYQIKAANSVFSNFHPVNDTEFVLWNSITQTLYLYSIENHSITKTLYEEKRDKEFSASVMYEFNDELYFTRSMSNEVYKLNNNGNLDLSYRWDFGVENLDLTKLNLPSDIGDRNKRISKMFQDSKIPYIITSQLQNSICYYAKIRFNMKDNVNVFYLKKQDKQLVFRTFSEGLSFFPLYWSDEFVIGLANVSDNMAVNSEILNEENALKLGALNEISNPCLVKYYFRTDLNK